MKRGSIILFAILPVMLLLVMPGISALISIDGPERAIYNLGDVVSVSGFVSSPNQFTGFLGMALNCNENKFQFPLTTLTLAANEKKNLNTEIQQPKITIPSSTTGVCSIDMFLMSDSNIMESARSKSFEVKKDLKGSFSMDTNKIQIGKSFRLTGNIYKLDGQAIEGSIEISFKNDASKFLIDISNTENGRLDYSYKAIQIPDGLYKIDLFVNDVYGNQQLFENVAEFTLMNQLYVTVRSSETTLKPGSKLKIYGDVRSPLEGSVLEGSVKINLDNAEYSTAIKNNKFEYLAQLLNNIKSGKHIIKITATDKDGNSGNAETTIVITPVQTSLKLKLNNEQVEPKETLEITPLLYDQANDIIPEDVAIEVYDTKNNLVFTDAVKSNSVSRYTLLDSSLPGAYEIKLSSSKLKAKAKFHVVTVSDLEMNMVNSTLSIKNIGNTAFKNPVKLVFNPGQISLIKKISLKPQKSTEIKLANEVQSGTYDISVIYNDKTKEFKNITILAKPKKSLNQLYYLIAIVFFVLAVYLSYIKISNSNKKKLKEEHEKLQAKKDIQRLREVKSKQGQGSRFSYHNMDRKQALDDFKHSYINRVKEPESKEGAFNLFDK